MDQSLISEIIRGNSGLLVKVIFWLAPSMAGISVIIWFLRGTWERVFGSQTPVAGSPRDHLRNAILSALPLALGVIWLWGISGTWLTNGVRMNGKELFLGGPLLGIINTFFYRAWWKPIGAKWWGEKIKVWFGQPPAGGSNA